MAKLIFKIPLIVSAVLISGSFVYFFVSPPKAISSNLENQTVIIKFDKPVARQSLQKSISPEIPGNWEFQNSLIKNHLFKTLIFRPVADFKENTAYQIKLENIRYPFYFGLSGNFSYQVPSKARDKDEKEIYLFDSTSPNPPITLLDIAIDWQDSKLSCEAASLKMGLAAKGIFVSENEIMEKIGYDPTPRQVEGNIWGDPNKAFVGDINGKIGVTGYGVYWEPVAKAANNWRKAEAFSGWNLEGLIAELKAGNPVVIWGALPVETITDISWFTPEGKFIKAIKEDHARLAVGFVGSVENPSQIIINDPLSGRLFWPTEYFLQNWKIFNNSGVVIR